MAASALAGGGATQLIWSQPSASEGWTPKAVSIGNRGTQVFSQVGPFADYTRLLSAHDEDPPAPVWTHVRANWTFEHRVASATDHNIHASLHKQYITGTTGAKRPVVAVYSSNSATPAWTYTIATDHYGSEPADVALSRDGQLLVATSYDIGAGFKTRVLVFHTGSPNPISNTLISTGGGPTRTILSEDGSTLYFWAGYTLTVFDVASAQTIWSKVVFDGPVRKGHALSGDGRTLAYAAADEFRILTRNGTNYIETHRYTLPLDFYSEAVALSSDGSTLVCGANKLDNLTVRILAMNVASHEVTMLHQITGFGTLSNLVSAIDISETGANFVVGLWGDELGTVPEVQFFDSRQNAPIGTHDLPGSVLALDLSPDGKRAVVASKAVHANLFAGGGSISLFDARPVDFRLNGVPVPGDSVEFELYAPGTYPSAAILIMSPLLAATPEVFPGTGTLYLQRNNLTFYSMGQIGPDGFARRSLQISPSTQVGTTLYYQGLRSNPRTLSKDWVKLTVVP